MSKKWSQDRLDQDQDFKKWP